MLERDVGNRLNRSWSGDRATSADRVAAKLMTPTWLTHLGCEGAHGGPGVDVGVQVQRLGAPAFEGKAHGGPVPAGQVRQPLVGEHVQGLVGPDKAVLGKGAEHLVDPAHGDASHQPRQLLTGA